MVKRDRRALPRMLFNPADTEERRCLVMNENDRLKKFESSTVIARRKVADLIDRNGATLLFVERDKVTLSRQGRKVVVDHWGRVTWH
jgi:hypothetical protein